MFRSRTRAEVLRPPTAMCAVRRSKHLDHTHPFGAVRHYRGMNCSSPYLNTIGDHRASASQNDQCVVGSVAPCVRAGWLLVVQEFPEHGTYRPVSPDSLMFVAICGGEPDSNWFDGICDLAVKEDTAEPGSHTIGRQDTFKCIWRRAGVSRVSRRFGRKQFLLAAIAASCRQIPAARGRISTFFTRHQI